MQSWAIFYADGSALEGQTLSDWIDAPVDGVLAVVQASEYTSRVVWRGKDFYYAEPDQGDVCATDDLSSFLVRRAPHVLQADSPTHMGVLIRDLAPEVKHGAMVSDRLWVRCIQAIKEYKTIPRSGPKKPHPEGTL